MNRTMTARWLPLAALGGAIAFSIFLAATRVRPRAFFSGDGGIKALHVRQHAAHGLRTDLALDAAPWAQALWRDGLYPFGPPFVYDVGGRREVAFPPAFAVATTPFYLLFGRAGLYLLPLLSAAGLWWALFALGRRLRLPPGGTAAAIAVAVAATPLAPYGAMFWEHLPAVALTVLGLVCLAGGRRNPAIAAGAIAALGGVLRPELFLFGALCLLAFAAWPSELVPRRRVALALAGAAGVAAAWAAVNLAAYGSPLGLHATQQNALVGDAASRGRGLVELLWYSCPIAALAPAVWIARDRPGGAFTARLVAAAVAFVLLVPLFVPNAGGKQWGSRYLLAVAPVAALAVGVLIPALLARRRAWWVGLAVLVVFAAVGVARNGWHAARELDRDYRSRILPALKTIEQLPEQVVAVTHQTAAGELEALMPGKTFFRVQGLDQSGRSMPDEEREVVPLDHARRLARGLADAGIDRFVLVAFPFQRIPPVVTDDALTLRFTPLGVRGQYALYRGVIGR